MKDDVNNEILKRLDTIVFLLVEIKDINGQMALKDKIKLLSDAGLGYNQIATALGKSPGSVAVQLTNLKKKANKSEKEEKSIPEQDLSSKGASTISEVKNAK